MTNRLSFTWPDPAAFDARNGRPIRALVISDEVEPTLESPANREGLGDLDMILGCGDLQPEYLSFVADALAVPMHYVRGNHDVGAAWRHSERWHLPEPLPDGRIVEDAGLRMLGFSGSPVYSGRGKEVSAPAMWLKAVAGWSRARGHRPVLLVTHAAPRGINDASDLAHRGFTSFRWLADRLRPPLWLHGHTALVRRNIDGRAQRRNGTLFYNATGATLLELVPPDANGR